MVARRPLGSSIVRLALGTELTAEPVDAVPVPALAFPTVPSVLVLPSGRFCCAQAGSLASAPTTRPRHAAGLIICVNARVAWPCPGRAKRHPAGSSSPGYACRVPTIYPSLQARVHRGCARANAIAQAAHAARIGTVLAAEERAVLLQPVADDLRSAMRAA